MDAIAEYLIKSEDFSKILATLLKEKVVDKIIGAGLRVDKKSGNKGRNIYLQQKMLHLNSGTYDGYSSTKSNLNIKNIGNGLLFSHLFWKIDFEF